MSCASATSETITPPSLATTESGAPHVPRLRARLAVLMFLQYAFPGALLQLYSVHLAALDFDALTIGVCSASQALATVLMALLAGQAADRWFAAERCLAVGSFLSGVLLLLLVSLHDETSVFVATLAFWMLAAPTLLIGTSVCFRHLERPDRDFGSVRLWGTLGWMTPGWLVWLWGRLNGVSGNDAPCRELFCVGSGFAFLLTIYALTLPPTPPQPDVRRKAAPLAALALLRRVPFAVYCFCTFGVCITYPFTTQATPLLLNRLGVPGEWLGPMLTLAQVSEVIVLFLLPMLLLRLGVRGTMLLGLIAWTVVLTILTVGHPLGLVVSSLGLNGLYIAGFLVAGQVFVNRQAGDGLRASVQALLTFVNGVGMLIGHLLVGYLRRVNQGELPQAFTVATLITGVMLVLFLVGFRARDE